ncbi:hypothetical protein [Arthrobacter sp. S41]|uniref:hypothetical protein n=1 Tax=Arthrobacter sp. S41 TaxID=2509721 RepID=UPI0010364895|nr:hypothetical protein [Arthrobacter sp. S41]TAP26821.1 hypothetical protein EYR88_00170 [Arthrobacter sp. S41]
MPKNMIPPFVQLKKMFKECAVAAGEKLSDRNAHRMAQGFMLSNACECSEDEQYFLAHSDGTGETAVKNALIDYINRFGSLKPRAVTV